MQFGMDGEAFEVIPVLEWLEHLTFKFGPQVDLAFHAIGEPDMDHIVPHVFRRDNFRYHLLTSLCSAWQAFHLLSMGLHRYNTGMTTKEIALKTIQELPDDASWEDVRERLDFVAGVRKGLAELDAGQGIPHEKIKAEFAEWLSD